MKFLNVTGIDIDIGKLTYILSYLDDQLSNNVPHLVRSGTLIKYFNARYVLRILKEKCEKESVSNG